MCDLAAVDIVMALRSLATREEILSDLSAAGEPFTPQVIERYRLAAGVAGGCIRVLVPSGGSASLVTQDGELHAHSKVEVVSGCVCGSRRPDE